MISTMLLLTVLELHPKYEHLGQIPEIAVCESFKFGVGTKLTSGTRISIHPFIEDYGFGSVVPAGDGAQCGSCWVPVIRMDSNGITYIHCEDYRDR